jgi:signal transduction histidine kinase
VKITCSLDPFIENRLQDKFKLNLFRIIQEQLNNIVKHAAANTVRIRLSQTKNSVALNIEDDGIGFDTQKKRKGVGVDNITSRAAAFNGNACFISSVGKGCKLNIHFTVNDSMVQKN